MQRTAATLDNRLDNRQPQAAAGALAVAPEALGQMLQIVFGNARPMIANQELHAIAGGFQAQFHRAVARGMPQRVVQQVT